MNIKNILSVTGPGSIIVTHNKNFPDAGYDIEIESGIDLVEGKHYEITAKEYNSFRIRFTDDLKLTNSPLYVHWKVGYSDMSISIIHNESPWYMCIEFINDRSEKFSLFPENRQDGDKEYSYWIKKKMRDKKGTTYTTVPIEVGECMTFYLDRDESRKLWSRLIGQGWHRSSRQY